MIRRVQALPGFIGRKVFRRRFDKSCFKGFGSTEERGAILSGLKNVGVTGTHGVGVKSVDIVRNSEGEGG